MRANRHGFLKFYIVFLEYPIEQDLWYLFDRFNLLVDLAVDELIYQLRVQHLVRKRSTCIKHLVKLRLTEENQFYLLIDELCFSPLLS